MISYLSGTIKSKSHKSIILDVNGIGYEIFITEPLLEKVKQGEQRELFTHLYIRENAMELYGFEKSNEKDFFELLISISGVGPKSALQVLSIAKLSEIKKAILRDDPSLLRKVSGIGQKTAERIVVELKNKLKDLPLIGEKINLSSAEDGVFDALQNLGYSTQEIRTVLRQIPAEIENENEIVKQALKLLGKK